MTQKTTEEKKPKKTPTKKLKDLEHTIDTLQTELKTKNEKLLRCLADQQNQQKRFNKELIQKENTTKTKYLLELLDIQDLLKKAQQDINPQQGIKLILQNLTTFLEKENITYIDCIGKPFNHTLHHAVTIIEQPDCDDNIIIDELKKGYQKDDLLLRPAHVVVSKKKESQKKEIENKTESE